MLELGYWVGGNSYNMVATVYSLTESQVSSPSKQSRSLWLHYSLFEVLQARGRILTTHRLLLVDIHSSNTDS